MQRYNRNHKFNFVLLVTVFFLLGTFLIVDKKIFEEAIVQSKFVVNNRINLVIYNAVKNITKKNNLTTDNFCNINLVEGRISSLSANTILINEFCSKLAVSIPDEFSKQGASQVKIPIGAVLSSLFGITFFNTLGPCLKIKMVPVGDALIDYETKFISAGINQTNFQVWLDVKFHSQIVNPFQRKQMIFRKKIPLINTIINGAVPNAYIDSKSLFEQKKE